MEQWIFIAFLVAVPVLYGANEAWNVWRDLRPDKMRAVFILGDKQIRSMRVTINSNGKTFDVSQGKGKRAHKYVIAESAVFHSGRFRIPTSYYNWGRIEPINLKSLTLLFMVTRIDRICLSPKIKTARILSGRKSRQTFHASLAP